MSSHLLRFYAGAVATALLLGGSAAHAFTIENGSGGATGGNAMAPSPFYDSTKKYDDKNSNGQSTMQFGNTSVYFGPGGSQYMRDQEFRNGMDRMFSPLGRPPD
jgi:hypothetical protein